MTATRQPGGGRRTAGRALARLGGAVLLWGWAPAAAAPQATPPPDTSGVTRAGVSSVRLSADTVGFGDRFELRLEISVPPGRTAYVPDLLPASDDLEGLGPAEWTLESLEDGGTAVSVRYPLLAYRVGTLTVPEFVVLIGGDAAAGGGPDGGGGARAEARSPVLMWNADRGLPGAAATASSHVVPRREVWVASMLRLDDLAEGLSPRPPDDVVGASWNAPAVASALLFGTLLLGLVGVSGRDWLALYAARRGARPAVAGDPIAAARAEALADLDRLLSGGPPGPDAVLDFYQESSGAVRRYVEHLDRAWSPAYTSTELMGSLRGLDERRAPSDLLAEMHQAEVVKFGRARPGGAEALDHCRTLRSWVEAS